MAKAVLVYAFALGIAIAPIVGWTWAGELEQEPPNRAAIDSGEAEFSLGLLHQQEAETETNAEARRRKLEESASAYENVLRHQGSVTTRVRGATLNNLAQVYAGLGRDHEAEQLFEEAIALPDPLRPFFRRNFANFLLRQGEWVRAAAYYRKTLEEVPEDLQAHNSLISILSESRPEAIPEYLWFLIGSGQASWVTDIALEKLADGRAVALRKEYLTLLVVSLAERSYLPEQLSSQVTDVLTNLTSRSDIGEGAREVLRLYQIQDFAPASYQWWAKEGHPGVSFDGQPTPRQAFRHLLRSLGEAEQKAERYDVARSYFRLSILLTPAEPDLVAFRMLVNLPFSSEDVAAIDRLAEWNEGLLRSKSNLTANFTIAVETARWKKELSRQANTATPDDLYFYRHDLGLLYSFFRRWEGKGPASGIYQLSQATQMGGVGPPDGPPDTPTFDARIYTRLAEGYTEIGKPPQARQTLIALVAAYRSHGLEAEADALQLVLNSGQGRRHPPDRRREVFDDPPLRLQDFTTEPPSGPPL